jgi:hypothetical protein
LTNHLFQAGGRNVKMTGKREPFRRSRLLWCGMLMFAAVSVSRGQLLSGNWDNRLSWTSQTDVNCTVTVGDLPSGQNGNGLSVQYTLRPAGGWIIIRHSMSANVSVNPITFLIKASSTDNLELKFTDADGSVFGRKFSLTGKYADWGRATIYRSNVSWWWGGDTTFGTPVNFEIAVSGTGSGTILLDEIGVGTEGLPATFSPAGQVLDPKRELAGTGFDQRRAVAPIPEDTLALEWLKVMQDNSSADKRLLSSQEGDDEAQTFNNSLAAMAFMLDGERERAERILGFYAAHTVRDNADLTLQNFFYLGEARGFYQHVSISNYHDKGNSADRWMGDMAWLLLAYQMYARQFDAVKYAEVQGLIRDLLVSYYKPATTGGYIQHGWRNGDRYQHEATGHHEGNIDCYAVLRLCGKDSMAANVKAWLDAALLSAVDLPLDLYSWRVLAFGASTAPLLNIPEYDFRYRKILNVSGTPVMGFYHSADYDINNFWLDGTGHMSCAFQACGLLERGWFYGNQYDQLLISKTLFGKPTRSLPYTLNRSGGFAWVDTTKGFTSTTAWYILAKHGFNPLTLETVTGVDRGEAPTVPNETRLFGNYPNPFNPTTNIRYQIPDIRYLKLAVYDLLGREVGILANGMGEAGNHTVVFNASGLASGVYYCRLQTDAHFETQKMILVR